MKKIFLCIMVMLVAIAMVSCNPVQVDEKGSEVISAEKLTEAFCIEAKSAGNNNLIISTSPSYYIWVYDATTHQMIGSGTRVRVQVLPPNKQGSFYIETRDMLGNSSQSKVKSIDVSEYTDLPEIYNKLFKINEQGEFTTTYWTWNTDAPEGVWGNGGYMESTGPAWFTVKANGIDNQCVLNNLPKDGIGGWFGLSLQGVTTSRGETGTVTVNMNNVKAGWDLGTITFTGTIPLLGIAPNDGKKRQYVYHIIKLTHDELRLCAPDPGAGDWGTAWFWNFKRIDR